MASKSNNMSDLKKITLSPKVIVSDPCYTRDPRIMGSFDNVKPGKYIPEITHTDQTSGWGIRVAELAVYHESTGGYVSDSRWQKADFEVGVDSGQAGIFSDSIYPTGDTTGEYGDKSTFYGTCCEATLGEGYRAIRKWEEDGSKGPRPEWNQGDTVFGQGVVSSSGYGDGGYDCFFVEQGGEIIAIKIVFITEEEEEDDYEDGYEEEED